MPGGRPTKYRIEYADQAYRYALLGATNERMCEFFDTSIASFDRWWHRHDEFRSAIIRGRQEADALMAQSLWHRGRGYSHEAVKIFMTEEVTVDLESGMKTSKQVPVYVPYTEHYPPDTNAASLWLRNRQPQLWRDKQEIEHTVKNASDRSDEELERIAFNDNEHNASDGSNGTVKKTAG